MTRPPVPLPLRQAALIAATQRRVQMLETRLDAVSPAASGKSKVTFSDTAPLDPAVDDVWFDTADGSQPFQWDGTEWLPYQWGSPALAADSVGTSQIATAAVGAAQIATAAVGTPQIATGAVGTSQIATAAVGGPQIATGAVGSSNIAANAITAAKLAAGLVVAGIVDSTTINTATLNSSTVNGTTINGSTFNGTDFIINSNGIFFFANAAHTLLVASIAGAPGNINGQAYDEGIALYDGPGDQVIMCLDPVTSIPEIEFRPAGVTHRTTWPYTGGTALNAGTATEQFLTILSSGKESGNDDAAIQLFSENANGTQPAGTVFEFGGSVFGTVTKNAFIFANLGTPPLTVGNAQLYGTTKGRLQVIDGADGTAYGLERRTLVVPANSHITSTGFNPFVSTQVSPGSYHVHGKILFAPDQTGGKMALQYAFGGAGNGSLEFQWVQCNGGGSAAVISSQGPQSPGIVQVPSFTMVSGTQVSCTIDGIITVTTAGACAFETAIQTSGDGCILLINSYVEFMPV